MSIKEFINYSKEEESFDFVQINTPLANLYAKKEDGKIIISYGVFTKLSKSEIRIKDQIFSSYEIARSKENKNVFILESNQQNLVEKLLDFIMAIYEVNYF